MYNIWRERNKDQENTDHKIPEIYGKGVRFLRRGWFSFLRFLSKLQNLITILATKAFFKIFPKAKKIFMDKDKLTGLEHGPSSYFLKSITPEKNPLKKNRRKPKNV
ncbi:hypothetical protein IT402_01430 [Candidatus Nomurabacteria bacterium]|nr:hypothetical protein [Candidatus Nomurabacteria bacterium]